MTITPLDTEAIRLRNERRREVARFIQTQATAAAARAGSFISEYDSGPLTQQVADCDALLAEVKRLAAPSRHSDSPNVAHPTGCDGELLVTEERCAKCGEYVG